MSVVRIVLSRTSADVSDDSVLVITSHSTTRISLHFPHPHGWCPSLPGSTGQPAPACTQSQIVGSSSRGRPARNPAIPAGQRSQSALTIRQFEGGSLLRDIGNGCNRGGDGREPATRDAVNADGFRRGPTFKRQRFP